jgi:hypothetical protein
VGHSPKRDHTPAGRVTNDDAATPRATLTDGLTSTSGGSASVPGCSCESMRGHPVSAWLLVSVEMSRDDIAWAANPPLQPTGSAGG